MNSTSRRFVHNHCIKNLLPLAVRYISCLADRFDLLVGNFMILTFLSKLFLLGNLGVASCWNSLNCKLYNKNDLEPDFEIL